MKVRNNLKLILMELGIKAMIPTQELLTNRLGGMSLIRFNKILANSSKTEITLAEARDLTRWLADITNQPEASIKLWEPVTEQEAARG